MRRAARIKASLPETLFTAMKLMGGADSSMRVLVTGAAGFIGHHLCRKLLERGFEVWGLDDLSRGDRARVRRLEELGMRFRRADVRAEAEVEEILRESRPDAVIHLAALISVPESFEKPSLYMSVNAEGTEILVSAANRLGVGKLIYASSAAVYGNPIRLPIDEDHPLDPISPYGRSKLLGEEHVLRGFRGRASIALRIFNVYGPGQSPEYAGVIVKFVERLRKNEPPIIFGDGEQTRDFIHVHDVAEAFTQALTSDLHGAHALNIASGKPIKIKELAELMIRLRRLSLKPVHAAPRPGDIKHSYADISKARKLLGWSPKTTLEEGLRMLLEST